MAQSLTTAALGANLKKAREEKGIKQNVLAREVDIAPQTISAYERGTKQPTLENLVALANVLDVSVDALLGKEEAAKTTYTLGDAARIIISLDKMEAIRFARIERDTELYGGDSIPAIEISELPMLAKFLTGYQKMRDLMFDGAIDGEIYGHWLSDCFSDLDGAALQ